MTEHEYRQACERHHARCLQRLRDENLRLRLELEAMNDQHYARATTAIAAATRQDYKPLRGVPRDRAAHRSHASRRLRAVGAALIVLLWSAPTFAQLQAPNRRDVVERVADHCPGLIQQDHAFTDAVATLLNSEDARWGRNGKRGNANDPSHDAVAYRNPASPFGVSVVDIIGAAGSPGASPAWIDQTQATINAGTTGVWVAPSGRLPSCLSGTGNPVPGTPDPPPVTPPPDLGPVQRDLAAIANTLSSIQARLGDKATKDDIGTIYRLIAEQLIAEHIGELVERVDKVQAQVDAIKVTVDRIAASRILRF